MYPLAYLSSFKFLVPLYSVFGVFLNCLIAFPFLETVTGKHEESIADIETKMAEAQDAPISSDYIQNTSLRFIEERIAIHQAELDRLEEKIYQISLTINK